MLALRYNFSPCHMPQTDEHNDKTVLRAGWGGTYSGRKDGMHYEINRSYAAVAVAAGLCLASLGTDSAGSTEHIIDVISQESRIPKDMIYRDTAEEWRAYEPHLDQLKAALGAVLEAYPQAPAEFRQR
mgnify:CR=1 FL=1